MKNHTAAISLAIAAVLLLADSCSAVLYKGPVNQLPRPFNDHPDDFRPQLKHWHPQRLQHLVGNIHHGNVFDSFLLQANLSETGLIAGQEVRLVVSSAFVNVAASAQNLTTLWARTGGRNITTPAFNISAGNVRIRVIAAFERRSDRGGQVMSCRDAANHDVWAEIWSLSPRSLVFGKSIVVSGYATFTVPPFDFRICVKDVSRQNATRRGHNFDRGPNHGWEELANMEGKVQRFSEPLYLFQGAASMQAGDFAAIKIIPHSTGIRRYGGVDWEPRELSMQDLVKLVPHGFPCTYEKATATPGRETFSSTGQLQYCGSNMLSLSGDFVRGATCPYEGSPSGGVAHIGTNRQHPLMTTHQPSDFQVEPTARIVAPHTMVAYLQLPDPGRYDICLSTRSYRRLAVNASLVRTGAFPRQQAPYDAQPLWFKLFDGRDEACSGAEESKHSVPGCAPRSTLLDVAAATHDDVTFDVADTTPGTWTAIELSGSRLNFAPATAWDHSNPREFATLAGGDMFRLVPEHHFHHAPEAESGNLHRNRDGSLFTTTVVTMELGESQYITEVVPKITTDAAGRLKFYRLGVPGIGTRNVLNMSSGCFWGGADNYGAVDELFGSPGEQCCTGSAPCAAANFCMRSDSHHYGPTASANLGGDPRHPLSPWQLDGIGDRAWAYVRVPMRGAHRVCYRRAGGNWRLASVVGSSPPVTAFTPQAQKDGYEYHVQDARAGTWGPWEVHSRDGATLTTQPSNFWHTSPTPPMPVVGGMFKIVEWTQNCFVAPAQPHTASSDAGLLEGEGSLGSADSSDTARDTVYFYARVPGTMNPQAVNVRFRVCFRNRAENWHALTDPNFHPVQDPGTGVTLSAPGVFFPLPRPMLDFVLDDNAAGTLAKLVVHRHPDFLDSTAPLDSQPGHDMLRVVPNATAGFGEVRCDRVFGDDIHPQAHNPATEDTDLGVRCALPLITGAGNEADYCHESRVIVTSGSQEAFFPYVSTNPLADAQNIRAEDGTLAFVTLPPSLNLLGHLQGYKVCYKQHGKANWIEASSAAFGTSLMLKPPVDVHLVDASGPFYAGQYGTLMLSSGGAQGGGIAWRSDVVKLVPHTKRCSAAAAGSHNHDDEEFGTLVNGGYQYATLVDARNNSQVQTSWDASDGGMTSLAAAFLVFPVISEGVAATSATFRVCYMRREDTSTTTNNWKSLGTIEVLHQGIVFALRQEPRQNGYVEVDVFSGGTVQLDSRPGRDAAKVVAHETPCSIHDDAFEPGITFLPIFGSLANHQSAFPTQHEGITDLGPGDSIGNEARFSVLLPTAPSKFKVCYKPFNRPWIQLAQTDDPAQRGFTIASSTISPAAPLVSSQSIGPDALGLGSPFSSRVMGGAAIRTAGDFHLVLTVAETAPVKTTLKFVHVSVEAPADVLSTIPGQSCLSAGDEVTYETAAGDAELFRPWGFPTAAGEYLVCIGRPGMWHVSGPPLRVADNSLRFRNANGVFTVLDRFSSDAESFASLHGDDGLYVVSSTVACGSDSWNGVAPASALVQLDGAEGAASTSPTDLVAIRVTGSAVPLPTTPGSYRVCVKKSQESSTAAAGVVPKLRSAQFYQVGSENGLPSLVVGSGTTQIEISGCDSSATTSVAAGTVIKITATQRDSGGAIVRSGGTPSQPAHANLASITYSPASALVRNSGGPCTPTSAPAFGRRASNLAQYLFDGQARFDLAFLSACPGGICTVNVASGSLSSESCAFSVSTTSLASIEIIDFPARPCRIGAPCQFRAVAMGTTGIAYGADGEVTVSISPHPGLAVAGNTSGKFEGGFFAFELVFSPINHTELASSTALQVTVADTDTSITSHAVGFTVTAPSLISVHIVDLFAVDVHGIRAAPLLPTWEPSSRFVGGLADTPALGAPAITASSESHLVARQFYTVVLRAVGIWPESNNELVYLDDPALLDRTRTITIDKATLHPDQRVLSTEGCEENITCAEPLKPVLFDAGRVNLTFRLLNSAGCTKANPCTLRFLFNGGNIGMTATQLTTPVRMSATRLLTQCGKDSEFDPQALTIPPVSPRTCTGVSSTVNEGWFLQVTAVDESGKYADEFFDGDAKVLFSHGPNGIENGDGVILTTVSALSGDGTASPIASFVDGQAVFRGLSVSRPCASGHCPIQVVSNWGAGIVDAGDLVAMHNTVNLGCTLTTPMMYCDVSGGICTPTTTPTDFSLLYTDTRICVDVQARDSTGANTLYETNWVHYHATDRGASQVPLTVTDAAGESAFAKRYKPMRRSKVSFCFSVSGAVASRVDVDITFAAQRFGDAGYWANGANGRCTIGPLTLWPKKLVAGLRFNSASTGLAMLRGANTPAALFAVERRTSAALAATLTLSAVDHYGNAVAASGLDERHAHLQVAIERSAGNVAVTPLGSIALRGLIAVAVDASATQRAVNDTIIFALAVSGSCLGCTISFTVVDPDAADPTAPIVPVALDGSATSPTATATLFVINAKPDTVRRLAFLPGTSPFGHWVNATEAPAIADSDPPVLHRASCLATTCKPLVTTFLRAARDGRGVDVIAGAGGDNLKMLVMVVDTDSELNAAFEPTGTSLATAKAHVDLFGTYTVNVAIGTQRLRCVTASCDGDGSSLVSQVIAAYGTTMEEAVLAFPTADTALRTTHLALQGIDVSEFEAVDSATGRITRNAAPSISGAFTAAAVPAAAASGSVDGITSGGYVLAWRPVAQPTRLVFRRVSAAANESVKTWNLYSPGALQAVAGSETDVEHDYTTKWPVGTPFPLTVEVRDAAGMPTSVSGGNITLAIRSWTGCNNGDLHSKTAELLDGRAVFSLKFMVPCENCVLEATLGLTTHPAGGWKSLLQRWPHAVTALSAPINVVGNFEESHHHVVITAADPDVLATPPTVSVTDVVQLTIEARAAVKTPETHSRLSFRSTRRFVAALYNRPAAHKNGWWYGNGGVLRSSVEQNAFQHHLVSGEGTSLRFMFTRTCAACQVSLTYRFLSVTGVDGGAAPVTRQLPHLFSVRSSVPPVAMVAGFTRGRTRRGQFISVSVWRTELAEAGRPAGVHDPDSSADAVPLPAQWAPVDRSNGDGGLVQHHSWGFHSSEVHRFSFTRPCNAMSVTIGGSATFTFAVTATATHLRPVFTSHEMKEMHVSLFESREFLVRAVDDLGFTDVTVGATSCAFGGVPFHCPTPAAAQPVSLAMTFNGTSAAAFPVASSPAMVFASSTHSVTGQLVNGEAMVSIQFRSPVRDAVPVFSVAGNIPLSSHLSSSRPPFLVPRITVSNGLGNLELVAIEVSDKRRLSTAEPWFVDVALVNPLADDTVPSRRFVAVEASHTIQVRFTDCPPLAMSTPTSFSLHRGHRRIALAFLDASTSCTVTFTTVSAACTGVPCSASIAEVAVKKVVAERFSFLRPTSTDNNGAPPGPRFGAAARRTFVTIQLLGTDANSRIVPIGSSGCPQCALRIRNPGEGGAVCNFAVSAPLQAVDADGTATISVTWKDDNVATYECALQVEVGTDSTFSTLLAAPNGGSTHNAVVTICRPVRVVMVTNTSTAFGGSMLRTGVEYSFEARTVTALGTRCFGDSQDEATQLSVDAVTATGVPLLSTAIFAANFNRTDVTAAGVANGEKSQALVRRTVRAVAGHFVFRVVFSNSTVDLGLPGIRVRVTAASVAPDISGDSNRFALSGIVETVVAASRLRFQPGLALPAFIVSDRVVATRPNSSVSELRVQAVDAVDSSWVPQQPLLTSAPNVARGSADYGNDAVVYWRQFPPPLDSVIPINFTAGRQLGPLEGGEARWGGFQWHGPDGTFELLVAPASPNAALLPTASLRFRAQRAVRLALGNGGPFCANDCALPNTSFVVANDTSVSPAPYLQGPNLHAFFVDAAIADANMDPVLGDNDSVVRARLVNLVPGISATIGRPPVYAEVGEVYVRVRNGVARFELGILGSTAFENEVLDQRLVKIEFSCPEGRPAHLLEPHETAANPCRLSSVTTIDVKVDAQRSPTFFADTPAPTREVLKVELQQDDVSSLDLESLVFELTHHLWWSGFAWINTDFANRFIRITACGVTQFYDVVNNDLVNVCGPERVCDISVGSPGCPPQVNACRCPGSSSSQTAPAAALHRYLLETHNHTMNTTAVVAELAFDLRAMPGFPGINASDVATAYTQLQAAALQWFMSAGVAAEFGVTRVSSRPFGSGGVPATPVPTAVPVVPDPPTPVPVVPTEVPDSAAAPRALLALAAFLLIMCL